VERTFFYGKLTIYLRYKIMAQISGENAVTRNTLYSLKILWRGCLEANMKLSTG